LQAVCSGALTRCLVMGMPGALWDEAGLLKARRPWEYERRVEEEPRRGASGIFGVFGIEEREPGGERVLSFFISFLS